MSLSDDTQADIIDAFNATSRNLDEILNIDNPYFEGMAFILLILTLKEWPLKFILLNCS